MLADPAPYLNTAILLRLLCEVSAIVIVTREIIRAYDGRWLPSAFTTIGVMLVVSFVAIGVAPRTLGRQHNERVALWSAAPLTWVTTVLGPIPRLLILIGNALTPGKGFREGPFSTETELRELVDIAEASALIEAGERKMIHSVFELGDTTVREVMVPRNDVVFVERHKNLRQTMSLFLRSGFSRVPVIDDNLDHVVGIAYLKDIVRRDFEAPDVEFTQRIDEVMRPVVLGPRVQADRCAALARCRPAASTSRSWSTSTAAPPAWSPSRTCSRRSSARSPTSTTTTRSTTETLDDGSVRVSSRYPTDDLDELFGFHVEEDDVDSVGGLMAKHLGLVPIPGSQVVAHGLRFTAEETAGRRNKIGTVRIARVEPDPEAAAHEPPSKPMSKEAVRD